MNGAPPTAIPTNLAGGVGRYRPGSPPLTLPPRDFSYTSLGSSSQPSHRPGFLIIQIPLLQVPKGFIFLSKMFTICSSLKNGNPLLLCWFLVFGTRIYLK